MERRRETKTRYARDVEARKHGSVLPVDRRQRLGRVDEEQPRQRDGEDDGAEQVRENIDCASTRSASREQERGRRCRPDSLWTWKMDAAQAAHEPVSRRYPVLMSERAEVSRASRKKERTLTGIVLLPRRQLVEPDELCRH